MDENHINAATFRENSVLFHCLLLEKTKNTFLKYLENIFNEKNQLKCNKLKKEKQNRMKIFITYTATLCDEI